MAAFGCHLSNRQAKHQNTGSRYVGARLLLTQAPITTHQRQQLKKTKLNQKHRSTREKPALSLLRNDCFNGISNMQTVLAD